MDAVAVSGERPAATDLAKGTLLEVLKARSLSRQARIWRTVRPGTAACAEQNNESATIGGKQFAKKHCKKLNARKQFNKEYNYE